MVREKQERGNDAPVQKDMLYEAQHRTAQRDLTFLDIMAGPNPLTQDELKKLVMKDPERYGRYISWIAL